MNRFAYKATTAAVMMAISGVAVSASAPSAPLNLNSNTSIAKTYASELNFNGDASGTAINGVGAYGSAGINVNLGFGVSAGQNRYIRFVLSPNANFSTATTASALKDATIGGTTASGFGGNTSATDGVTVANGGSVTDRCVVFQITGYTGPGNASSDTITWTLPNIDVTPNDTVSLFYTLHETGTSASCANVGPTATKGLDNALLTTEVSHTLFSFESGAVFSVTPSSSTASVANLYKTFTPGSADSHASTITSPSHANDVASLGNVLYTNSSNVFQANGTANVTLANVITSANLVLVGSNGVTTAANFYLDDDANATVCDTASYGSGATTGTFSGTPTTTITRSINTQTLTGTSSAGAHVCYLSKGTDAIPEQVSPPFTFALDVLTGGNLGTSSDRGPLDFGTIAHDGTVLKVPYMQDRGGQTTLVQLTNFTSIDAPYTTRCLSTGATFSTGTPGTVPANKSKVIGFGGTGCPTSTTNAIELTLAVPEGSVSGTLVRANKTTGDSSMDGLVGNQ